MSEPVPIEALLAHRDWVRGLARSLVTDPGLADDVEQETWLAALRHPPHDAVTVRPWFVTVARNFARQGRRGVMRRSRREEAVARPERQPATDEVVAQAETHKRVVLAVMDLDEPYRTTILLRYFEGLSVAECASRVGVAEDTFRTRLRRGVERLRAALGAADVHANDWRVALLPLARDADLRNANATANAGMAVSSMPRSPARWSPVRGLATAALVFAGAVGVWFAVVGDDPAPAGAAPPAEPRLAVAFDDARGAAPVPPAPPNDDGPKVAPPGPPGTPADAASQTPAAPLSTGALRLVARIETDVPRSGDAIRLLATVRNDGPGDSSFFVPDTSADLFADWSLRRDDGTVFVPVAPSSQSMWNSGMDGRVVRLAAGEEWSWRGSFEGFEPIDPAAPGAARLFGGAPLPPGNYVVKCSYAWTRTTVPWRAEAFRIEERPYAGLWTGTAHATDQAVRVAAPSRPQLLLDGPTRLAAGQACELGLRLVNPLRDPLLLRGRFRAVVHAKGEGSARAGFIPATSCLPTTSDDVVDVEVPAESESRWMLDPALLTFTRDESRGRPASPPCGFHELRPMGSAIVGVEFVAERADGAALQLATERASGAALQFVTERASGAALQSPWLFVAVDAPRDASPTGLRIELTSHQGDRPRSFVVRLRNDGARSLRVPRRLSLPAELTLSLRRTDGASAQLGWKGDAFERAAPLTATDFVDLAPGAFIDRTLDVDLLLAAALPAGTWIAEVGWRSLEDGRRLGVTDPAPVVGRLTSNEVVFDVSAEAPTDTR
ncbi:MAG: sigma-70 family RNA polymerase sigma factor [Planctomycetes bacterium]|nr:sigma-70 family RNA polymerase sigma factor [Planctomycetota bacterium]